MMREVIRLVFFTLLVASHVSCQQLWPKPQLMTNGTSVRELSECDFMQFMNNTLTWPMKNKLQMYQKLIYPQSNAIQCQRSIPSKFVFSIHVRNTSMSFSEIEQMDESYSLSASMNHTLTISSPTYFGFLRALETLSQLLTQPQEKDQTQSEVMLPFLPFEITDAPVFKYRGVMIDTARNYLKKESIMRTLDVMMYNKLNVLHWHITDDESFPIELPSIPEMAKAGAYSKKYTYSFFAISEIVEYAKQNGIRVIPEVDSPGHVRSWGLSKEYANITVACPGGERYNSLLDPTLDLTYQANDLIFKDIQNLFPGQYVHMGGDEVFGSCWNQKPSIKEFMVKMNITDYDGLQRYYRNRQKQSISDNRKKIYWANEAQHIPPAPEDIIQFWGNQSTYKVIADLPNKVVLSPEDYLYINTGFNFIWGNYFGNFTTWLNVYQVNLAPAEIDPSRILGAEVTLWGEVNTDQTLDTYLWPRSSALAERLWTGNHLKSTDKGINMTDLASRLSFMEDLLVARGINAAPVTNRFCKQNINLCFDWRSANVTMTQSFNIAMEE